MVSILELLGGDSSIVWESIKNDCEDVVLNGQRDTVRWMLTTNGKFTVKSLYEKMILNNSNFPQNNTVCGKLRSLPKLRYSFG